MSPATAHITIEVDLSAQPIEGNLQADDGIIRTFAGYMQFITVLEAAIGAAREAHAIDSPLASRPIDV